jgi:hypothetical protein
MKKLYALCFTYYPYSQKSAHIQFLYNLRVKKISMDTLQFGLMLPGAKSISEESANQVWKAHVETHSGIVPAYVKWINPRKIYIECLCAILGRYLGLPIPKPILVKIDPDSKIGGCSDGLAFGSEDTEYPSFNRSIQPKDVPDILGKYSKSVDIGLFDEWIGNWDRNMGNILFDGGKEFFFIDHENAIARELRPDEPAESNQVVSSCFCGKSEFEKHRVKDTGLKIIPRYKEVPYLLLAEKTHASYCLSETEVVEIITFLKDRVDFLGTLFKMRLGLKQSELIYNEHAR